VFLCRKLAKSILVVLASRAAISIIEFTDEINSVLDKNIALLHYFEIVQFCKTAAKSCRNFVLFNVDIRIAMQ